MNQTLPENLFEAEDQITNSILKFLSTKQTGWISIDIRFEGLRIMPVGIRLCKMLQDQKYKTILIFGDAGSTALAKRDAPELISNIKSFKEILAIESPFSVGHLLLAVSPQPYDYEEFENICQKHNGNVIMLNGKLDDSEVGIGSVARARRKGFFMKWQNIYWLQPLKKAALLHTYSSDWIIFKETDKGYIKHQMFTEKPDSETIFESLL